ncbi:MAG: bifunctional D-glycero-beta-D-manno-heptose-7-phosphate kinase/D-glycero-beta-D-manno-heptose 1-phosphate adenylyltransferase HldE [Magnetococcales bacterium]|nr:bifunctional D-glycero-beta-D-manno-heptose-7-phosphate kinase/D-glycero-beta-D-manno-heptose 1-phosphate adenylyltransferase HldE [Magnetococcales bacterium]
MFQNRTKVINALHARFYEKSVLVVGDIMLDRYLWGEVLRVSPEAPVPVVRLTGETESAGAAANVALNLANLGIRARLVGVVGDDDAGRRLRDLISLAGIDGSGIRTLYKRPTITKTRIIGGHQQMLRIDLEETDPLPQEAIDKLLERILKQLNHPPLPGAVILSDYGKGVLSESVCQAIITGARKLNIPVLVDPKGVNYEKYRGATTLTPNRKELATAIPFPIDDLSGLLEAGEALRKKLDLDFLTVTLSEQGIALLDGNQGAKRIPAVAREVYDVSGAGDTVVSAFAAGLSAGLDKMDALHLANLAAGVVVGKVGTTPITQLDLVAALSTEEAMGQSSKICTLNEAQARLQSWRKSGGKIVFTNGCFDLLHTGHVTYMEDARNLGDRLIIGLNTDRSVRRLKGPSRPIIHEKDRARVLAAMASVDMVILFDEETPMNLINAIKPDILAKGADYTEATVVGAKEVKSWGGQIALIPLVQGHSSSRIVDNIKTPKEK